MLPYIHIHVEYEPPKQQHQNNASNDPSAAGGSVASLCAVVQQADQ